MKHTNLLTIKNCLIAVFTAMSLTLVSCKKDKNEEPQAPAPNPVVTYTLTALSNDEEMGTVTGGGTYEEGTEVTLTATPNCGFIFLEWIDGNTDNPRKLSVTSDLEITAIFDYVVSGIDGNNHEYVDLGLPSGLKWATCNVGAITPEGYGNYYAWGEIATKETYEWSNYSDTSDGGSTFIKYTTDTKTVLDLEDDAANVNWGGKWRMPTKDEWQELIDNCTWTWTMYNGKFGYRVTSKTNGYSIFLIAAGTYLNTVLVGNNVYGAYWTSSLNTNNPNNSSNANAVTFDDKGNYYTFSAERRCGGSVRGVFE
ncbi:MAG: hypothetical protein ACI30B_08040 [Paludibacteraceae bacterium]